MLNCLYVGLGGALGAVGRYLMGQIPLPRMSFPVMTLVINFLGAFLIGIISAAAVRHGAGSTPLILFLKVGVCGGFTTFSTFALETTNLLGEGKMLAGMLYIILSVCLCMGAVMAGGMLAK